MSAEQQTNQSQAEEELARVLSGSDQGLRLATDLFGVADLLKDMLSLLRSVTDTGRAPADRAALVQDLFGPACASESLRVLSLLAAQHWSSPKSLVDTVGALGVIAALRAALADGQLDAVEKELFAVGQLLAEHRDLRIQLSELGAGDRDSRATLVADLLQGSVSRYTVTLVTHAVVESTHGRLLQTIRRYSREAARLNGARLVTVTSARPLNEVQQARMKALVEKQLGQKITLAVGVDPTLLGGYRLNYGDEAVDASIRSDIAEAKRELVR